MKKMFAIMTGLLMTSLAPVSEAQKPIQVDWLLQSEGASAATSMAFLPNTKTNILLSPILTSEWDCIVGEVDKNSAVVSRDIQCFHKDAKGMYTSAIVSNVACRTDGSSSIATSTFMSVVVFTIKDNKPVMHSMKLSLHCVSK